MSLGSAALPEPGPLRRRRRRRAFAVELVEDAVVPTEDDDDDVVASTVLAEVRLELAAVVTKLLVVASGVVLWVKITDGRRMQPNKVRCGPATVALGSRGWGGEAVGNVSPGHTWQSRSAGKRSGPAARRRRPRFRGWAPS